MRKLLLILFLFQVVRLSAQAPLVHGAEIYYDKIGQTTYKITAQVYRYCSSGPLNDIKAYVIADTFKIPLQMKRVSISRINDTCKNPCQNVNAVGNKGFERHVFVDTVNFSSSPFDSISKAGICQVMFAIHDQLREPGITTHELHNNMLFIESMANICLKYNNYHSPKFSFEPRFLAPCNWPFAYTPAPIDTMEFDSLGFELDAIQYNFQKNVTYKGIVYNYTKSIPMAPYCPPNPGAINCRPFPNAKPPRGFYFDDELCQLIFTPSKCDEIGNIAFKVSEYRRDSTGKFKLIGYVKREITITVGQYPDNSPSLLSGNTKFTICGNNQICINSNFYDDLFIPKQTIPDTIRINWNGAIPDSNLKLTDSSAREKTTQFCWNSKPHYTNERLYFGIQAYDKKCNAYISSYNYYIQTGLETEYTKNSIIKPCGKILVSAKSLDSSEKIRGSINIRNRTKSLFNTTNLSDSFVVLYNDTYYIRYSFSSNLKTVCSVIKIDTVIVNNTIDPAFVYKFTDTSVCKSFPAKLGFSPTKFKNFSHLEWYKNDTLFNTTDTIIQPNIYSKIRFNLKLYTANNCQSNSVRSFTPIGKFVNLLSESNNICDSLPTTITPNIGTLKLPVSYRWKLRNVDTFSSENLSFYPKKNEKVYLTVVDDNHCQVKDSILMIVYELPDFWMDKSKSIHTICTNGLATIATDSFKGKAPHSIRWKVNGVDSIRYNNNKTLSFQLNNATKVNISVTDSNGCYAADSMIWEKPDTARVSLLDTGLHCYGMPFTVLAKIRNNTYDKGQISWSVNGNLTNLKLWDTVKTFTAFNPINLQVNFYGRYNCKADTLIKINFFPQPRFKILGDTVYNKANYILLSCDKPYSSYRWSDGKTTRDNGFWAYLIGPPAFYSRTLEVTDSNGCKSEAVHYFRTNGLTGVNTSSKSNWQIYPNPGSDIVNIKAPENGILKVYSAEGKLIKTLSIVEGMNKADVSDLSAGYYLLQCGSFRSTLLIE